MSTPLSLYMHICLADVDSGFDTRVPVFRPNLCSAGRYSVNSFRAVRVEACRVAIATEYICYSRNYAICRANALL